MNQIVDNDVVSQKTRELAEAILGQDGFAEKNAAIESFLADDEAKGRYTTFMEKRQELYNKERQGTQLTEEDRQGIEKLQAGLLADTKIKSFLDAQESLNSTHQAVTGFIGKAMELGRIPTDEEMSGCCGGGESEGGG